MKHSIKVVATLALALALSGLLVACGGGQASSSASSQASSSEQAASSASSQASAAAGALDVWSWKTLGDALAAKNQDGVSSATWDDEHYIAVFSAGDSVVRVVAAMDAETDKRASALDASDDDYNEKFAETVGSLKLESAEDLTSEKIPQSELDAYVGKTGQDLIDEGFTFEQYWMYGGEETGATMAKGYLAYNFTFDTTVDEDKADDEGAAIKDATITAAEFAGGSNAAVELPLP